MRTIPSVVIRFLMAGGFNTVITYLIYLMALGHLGYAYAYTLSYVSGLLISYTLNRKFVFQSHRGWLSFVLMPTIYLAQYGLGLFIVWLWVDQLGWRAEPAPLIATACSLPITFLLSKWLFTKK